MDCPFCNIIQSHTERIIHETEYTCTILSDPRLMEGHTLVIPKRHVEKLSELSANERKELLDESIRVEEKLLTIFSGCDVTQHYRPFIAQSALKVDHLHIHVRPREFDDDFYKKVLVYEREVFTALQEEEFVKFAEVLK